MEAKVENPTGKMIVNTWGPYYDCTLLGKGAYGEVHKCTKFPELANVGQKCPKVVLKLISKEKFLQYPNELIILETCNHENIVKLVDEKHFVTDHHHILVMEYCRRSLLQLLKAIPSGQYLKGSEIIKFLLNICEGLKYLREKNTIHNDIKPENILIRTVTKDGVKTHIAVLADMGFGQFIKKEETYSEHDIDIYIGTYAYMSPQALENTHRTYKSDIFSLGVTLYMMIFKRHPYPNLHSVSQVSLNDFYRGGKIIFDVNSYGRYPFLLYIVWWCMQYKEENRPNIQTLLDSLKSFSASESRAKIVNKIIQVSIHEKASLEILNSYCIQGDTGALKDIKIDTKLTQLKDIKIDTKLTQI